MDRRAKIVGGVLVGLALTILFWPCTDRPPERGRSASAGSRSSTHAARSVAATVPVERATTTPVVPASSRIEAPATRSSPACAGHGRAHAADDGSIPEARDEDQHDDEAHGDEVDEIHSSWLPEEVARRLDAAGAGAIRAVARRAIPAAAQLMKAKNPARPLEPAMREKLRPTFGDLVDRVRVADEASFPDDALHTAGVEAMTIGDRVYVRGALRADDPAHVRMLAHELVHVRQFERFGRDLADFSEELARQLSEARWDEEQTEFEREANGLVILEGRRGGLAGTLGELARD